MRESDVFENERVFPLLLAIGEIDDSYVESCVKPRKRKQFFTKIGAIAAIFCLCIAAVMVTYMTGIMLGGAGADMDDATGDAGSNFSPGSDTSPGFSENNSGSSAPGEAADFGIIVTGTEAADGIMNDFGFGNGVLIEGYAKLKPDENGFITLYLFDTPTDFSIKMLDGEENAGSDDIIAEAYGKHARIILKNLDTGTRFLISGEGWEITVEASFTPSGEYEIKIEKDANQSTGK